MIYTNAYKVKADLHSRNIFRNLNLARSEAALINKFRILDHRTIYFTEFKPTIKINILDTTSTDKNP